MMKKFIIILGILILCQLCPAKDANAEFYVFYDKDTLDVLFITKDKKDVVLSDDDKIKIRDEEMVGEIADYPLQYPIEYYKLINKTFIVNTQKLSDEVNQQAEDEGKQAEWRKVKMRAYYTAYLDLINEYTFQYLQESDFEQ